MPEESAISPEQLARMEKRAYHFLDVPDAGLPLHSVSPEHPKCEFCGYGFPLVADPTNMFGEGVHVHRDPKERFPAEDVLELVAEVRRLQGPGDHIIDFHSGGWTIQHPLSCRPDLFVCKVNRAAESQIANAPKLRLGRYRCYLAKNGRFMVGEEQV